MTARWPGYYERATPLRTYAMDLYGRILTEHGQTIQYHSWTDLRNIVLELNLILLAPDLFDYLLMGAIDDKKTTVYATSGGGLRCISIRDTTGHKSRVIVPALAWGEYTIGMMKRIRQTMHHCCVGDRATPSALGTAIMRTVWQKHDLPWHRAVPRQAQTTLRDESASPRTETPGVGFEGEEAWEYDLVSAFANHFNVHPTGRVMSIEWDDHEWYSESGTWFRACYVKHPADCEFTNVPRRVDNQWLYVPHYAKRERLRDELVVQQERRTWDPGDTWEPITSDTCTTWLWREQADMAREIGCLVIPGQGWAWYQWTEDNRKCVERFMELKRTAPERILPFVKGAIVSAIGRHAMQSDEYVVIDHYVEDSDCRPLARFCRPTDESPFTPFYLLLRKKDKGGMIHWQRYTVMQTNETIFRMARSHHKEVLMVNFDSLTLRHPIPKPEGWKEKHLHNVTIPYPRAILSQEKRRTPGRTPRIELADV